MVSTTFALTWSVGIRTLLCVLTQATPNIPPELDAASRKWIEAKWRTLQEEADLLIEAYDLEEELLPVFWNDYYRTCAEMRRFEREGFAKLRTLEGEAAMQWLRQFAKTMPMNPDKLADLAEALLEPGDFSAERRRYFELRHRRDQRAWLSEDESIRRFRLGKERAQRRLTPTGKTTPSGTPAPAWVIRQQQSDAKRERAESLRHKAAEQLRNSAMASRRPGGAALRRIPVSGPGETPDDPFAMDWAQLSDAAAGPPVGPSEDRFRERWADLLDSRLKAPGMTDERRTSARRLSSRLWERVQAYRQELAASYEELDKLSSKSAYAARRAEIEGPLAALLAELSVRLEAF